jgi:hypothetical protein
VLAPRYPSTRAASARVISVKGSCGFSMPAQCPKLGYIVNTLPHPAGCRPFSPTRNPHHRNRSHLIPSRSWTAPCVRVPCQAWREPARATRSCGYGGARPGWGGAYADHLTCSRRADMGSCLDGVRAVALGRSDMSRRA